MRNPSSAATTTTTTRTTTTTPCCSKEGLKRGPWTPEEDELLCSYIRREGEGKWRTLPKRAGLLRCGKSCRLRWMNYLRPSVKRGQITPDEEDLILRLHLLLGNRWALIAGRIPGRTDNEIKNYWNTHLSKKLISQGVDPRTHRPLSATSNPNPSSTSRPPKSNTNPNFSHSGLKEISKAINNDQDYRPTRNSVKTSTMNFSDEGDLGVVAVRLDQSDNNRGTYNEQENNSDVNSVNFVHYSGNCDGGTGGEDVFCSYLDPWIEEDVFANQLHQQQQQQFNGIAHTDLDPLVLPSQFGCGTMWEANGLSSFASAFGEDET
ncbi:hypothetical protein Sjap_012946 [Stephania japonica]|uniref:Uncharacterized protein n=1 Tax=Stephania japonica TaxID=461633 RepID=A0AAP0IX40_9MAGN